MYKTQRVKLNELRIYKLRNILCIKNLAMILDILYISQNCNEM